MLAIPDTELAKIDWDDRAFVTERLSRLPAKAQKILFKRYTAISSKQARNTYLRELVDSLISKLTVSPEKLNLHISEHSDQSFRDYPITHFGLNRSLIPRLSDHF